MALRFKPQHFGPVLVFFEEDGSVAFSTAVDGPRRDHPPYDKPVLTLMASVGHCLVESIRIVAERDGYGLSPFAISVEAEKATDLPGRLKLLRCKVYGAFVSPMETADDMISRAKSICTVSNTLGCEVLVERSAQ